MKRIHLSVCIVTGFLLYAGVLLCDPLMVVTLMVKNEEPVMRSTLQPFADAGIDSYLILDTGSTDNTVAETERFFKENNIKHGYIVQQPFVDFSTSRNYALRCTEEKFPCATFLLMIDAEWHVNDIPKLLQFAESQKNKECEAYLILINSTELNFHIARLLRAHRDINFVGVVHEVPDRKSYQCAPSDIFFELHTTKYGHEKSKLRWQRDVGLLQKELERNPTDPRTLFYLAQTYDCLGDMENARVYYTKRLSAQGWEEENFMAYYRLAQVYEKLNKWDLALHYYEHAFLKRPVRVEPLIRIANYYLMQQKYASSFVYALQAVNTPFPKDDVLFIDKYLYDFVRYDILGQCAWHGQQYTIGEAAVRQALKVQPDAPHLHTNLGLYTSKTKSEASHNPSCQPSHEATQTTSNLKLLVLIIASDDAPVYTELQKIWRSYMHYDRNHVEAYFIRANPLLKADYEIQGDVIWVRTPESLIPGIANKTILSLEALLPRIKGEFNYVLRTNLSSFYVFPRLLDFLNTCEKTRFYSASLIPGMPGMGSGAGFLMSPDVAELLVQHKNELLNVMQWDDVLIAQFLNQDNDIPLIEHPRIDFCTLETWNEYKDMLPHKVFHYRVKNEPFLRLANDTFIQSNLVKKFYLS